MLARASVADTGGSGSHDDVPPWLPLASKGV